MKELLYAKSILPIILEIHKNITPLFKPSKGTEVKRKHKFQATQSEQMSTAWFNALLETQRR